MNLTRVQDSSPFNHCSALVVDGRSESAQRTLQLLRQLGMGEVVRAVRPLNARTLLETRPFDYLFCDYDYDDSPANGQDFIDELREAQVLPYGTVVFFVTSEASRAKVADVAESGLDQYLLKPFTEASFTRRVEASRLRKLALAPIFDAMNRADFATTLDLCEQEITKNGKYWLVAAHLGAEACLRTRRHGRARQLYEGILARNALPWARLGLARVEVQRGDHERAQLTLDALITEHPSYVDAYDVLGRSQMERGQLDAALGSFGMAARLTPTCVRRLQKVAQAAFLSHDSEAAASALARAVHIGRDSRLLDMQSLLLLCFTDFDERALARLENTAALLRTAAADQPGSYRLARFVDIAETLLMLEQEHEDAARAAVQRMSLQLRDGEFDFEAASNFLCLLDRFDRCGLHLPEARAWVLAAALRFCVSRVAVELLRNCARVAAYCATIDEAALEIATLAKAAVARLLAGERQAALASLTLEGGRTLNGRLLEIAQKVCERHADPALIALRDQVAALRLACCSPAPASALQLRPQAAAS
ncbi:MAG: response regulator [Pseudomonadota bacterium]|nr:response regulator [Pseudomonadota bacterium]